MLTRDQIARRFWRTYDNTTGAPLRNPILQEIYEQRLIYPGMDRRIYRWPSLWEMENVFDT